MNFARYPEPAPRRVIDVAVGILVGLRRCSEEKAFEEIAEAVRRTGLPLSETAGALVALATANDERSPSSADAQRLWGDLLPGSRVDTRLRP
jgi:hypothetical protein